jgi:hypothetical protein
VDQGQHHLFFVHGCFALLIIGQKNIKAVRDLICNETSAKCPIDVLYHKYLQEAGKAYICSYEGRPEVTHVNKFQSDATCPGKRIDTHYSPVFGYEEKGRVRELFERGCKTPEAEKTRRTAL